jgi:succinate-semialdehyde dehydrogenase / glutarate-semialdehyde dehydrogenase
MTTEMLEKTDVQNRNLIGGEWVRADSGAEFDVLDPATDEVIVRVPKCGRAEAKQAIQAAAEAFDEWRRRPAAERSKLLRKTADLMLRDQERLARLMTMEQGKPLAEARGEVAYAASFIEWAAEEGKRIYGEMIPANFPDKRILVLRQPIGVTACITPWNFPIAMITRKLGPALAAGNTMVVKPAEETPLSALAFGELALEAGIPAGVINIITGDPAAIGDELFENFTVRKISFTGSTEVGKMLIKKSAHNVTRLSMELGGHAPFLVFDDADVDAAVTGAIASKYRNMGQTCICANRFYVQDGIYEAFAKKLAEKVQQMKVGRGLDDGVAVGPLINDDAIEKVERHVADATSKGGKVRTGGERVKVNGLADRFFAPTVIDDFDDDMLVNREETFGPVAPLRRFSTEDDALRMANDSIYGLASYFYTRDASRLMRVAEALEYGIVGANDGGPSTAQAPFGGVKQSGFGREGGKYVMDEYTEIKYISWQL